MPAVATEFAGGQTCQGRFEIEELTRGLRASQLELGELASEEILAAFDAFAERLRSRDNPLHREYPGAGLAFVGDWCRAKNLRRVLDVAFADAAVLDDFVTRGTQDRQYRAFPRGLVVHWLAGNVPTLGFLSLVVGLLTKNANLVKLPSAAGGLVAGLLEQLGQASPVLARAVSVIRYEREQREIARSVAAAADARLLWGGDEAIRHLRGLPTGLDCVDVVFPHRTSFVVLGGSALAAPRVSSVARRLAQDISVFEQKACASPHTVFLLRADQAGIAAFAEELQQALQAALRSIPKTTPAEKEVSALLKLRAQYDMFHQAWYSSGTEFSILSDEKLQLGPAMGNRTVFLRSVDDPERLAELVTPQVQSVGIEADPEDHRRLTSLLGARGVLRFAKPGAMTLFESPWDGVLLPQRLVRWCARPTPAED